MTNKDNLTIADIASETSIAESTLRFYRNKFGHYLPSVGEGRKRRYEPQAIMVFQEIADLSSKGMQNGDIDKYLGGKYAHNPIIIELENETAVTAIEPQQPQYRSNRNDRSETAVTAVKSQRNFEYMEMLLKMASQREPERLYCTVKEASFRTGFSQNLIKKSCRAYLENKQGIPCAKTGRGYVIHKALLDDWFTKLLTDG